MVSKYYFEELSSTNDYARQNLQQISKPCIISTQTQTGGKGRLDRSWSSPPGNIYATFVACPNLTMEVLTTIPLMVALAVCDGISEFRTQIKWPNDVFISNKKVCGILCESVLSNRDIDALIMGFGVNIEECPEGTSATSLKKESSKIESADVYLDRIVDALCKRLSTLEKLGFEGMRAEYISKCILMGKVVMAFIGNEEVEGICIDISPSGALVLRTSTGEREVCYGDVTQKLRY